jgi:hypothetical protein
MLHLTKNPITYQLVEIDPAIQYVHLRLFCETASQTNTFFLLAELEMKPQNFEVIFYLQEYLDKALQADLPTFNTSTTFATRQTCKKYKVSYALQDAATHYLDLEFIDDNTTSYAHLGGFEIEDFPTKGTWQLPKNSQFLTKLPYLIVDRDQQAYISFMPFANNTNLAAGFTIILDDHSSYTNALLINAKAYQPIIIPIGFDERNYLAALPAGRSIKQIDLTIATKTISFQIVQNYWLQTKKELHYFNSSGGWDSLLCTGTDEQNIEVDKATHQHYLAYNYLQTDSPQRTYNQAKQRTGKLRSGYLPKAIATVMIEELLMSPSVLLRQNDSFLPLIITTKKANYHKGDEFKGFFEVEYELY